MPRGILGLDFMRGTKERFQCGIAALTPPLASSWPRSKTSFPADCGRTGKICAWPRLTGPNASVRLSCTIAMPDVITSGQTMSDIGAEQPDWNRVLAAASRRHTGLPDAALAGGTAAGLHAGHRISHDTRHVIPVLREFFNRVLDEFESAAGWKTARVRPPVLILGSADGIETGVRQLIRDQPS